MFRCYICWEGQEKLGWRFTTFCNDCIPLCTDKLNTHLTDQCFGKKWYNRQTLSLATYQGTCHRRLQTNRLLIKAIDLQKLMLVPVRIWNRHSIDRMATMTASRGTSLQWQRSGVQIRLTTKVGQSQNLKPPCTGSYIVVACRPLGNSSVASQAAAPIFPDRLIW